MEPARLTFGQAFCVAKHQPYPQDFVIAHGYRLRETTDIGRLKAATEATLKSSEIIRTAYRFGEQQVFSSCSAAAEVSLPWLEVDVPGSLQDVDATSVVEASGIMGQLDLSRGINAAGMICRFAGNETIFFLIIHHFVSDALGAGFLVHRIDQRYASHSLTYDSLDAHRVPPELFAAIDACKPTQATRDYQTLLQKHDKRNFGAWRPSELVSPQFGAILLRFKRVNQAESSYSGLNPAYVQAACLSLALSETLKTSTQVVEFVTNGRRFPQYNLELGTCDGWVSAFGPLLLESADSIRTTCELVRQNIRTHLQNVFDWQVAHYFKKCDGFGPLLGDFTVNLLGDGLEAGSPPGSAIFEKFHCFRIFTNPENRITRPVTFLFYNLNDHLHVRMLYFKKIVPGSWVEDLQMSLSNKLLQTQMYQT